ncbi:MAG: acetyl-CoA carboxylase biotin carboxylase subunit family protein [Phenylobacterium sp.]
MGRVLLLDTNIAAGPLLAALKSEGHSVTVAGGQPSDVLARAHPDYVQLDYSDTEETLRLFDQGRFDHLVPGCNDRSYQTCAEIADRRPIAGVDGSVATHTLNNKGAFRAWAQTLGLPVPRTLAPGQVRPGQPVIVKPEESYSGRGATVLRTPTPSSLAAALEAARAESRSGACVIEEFVEGQLYSHTAFVDRSGVRWDTVVVEHGSANPLAVDTSHVTADFPGSALQEMRSITRRMVSALDLKPGLLHTQLILGAEGLRLIEVTRRCPGDLYSLLISLSTGADYAGAYVRPFLGEDFGSFPEAAPARPILRHTLSSPAGAQLGSLRFSRPVDIERLAILALSGDDLAPSPRSRAGLLFLRARDALDLAGLTAAALERRLYEILPGEAW